MICGALTNVPCIIEGQVEGAGQAACIQGEHLLSSAGLVELQPHCATRSYGQVTTTRRKDGLAYAATIKKPQGLCKAGDQL